MRIGKQLLTLTVILVTTLFFLEVTLRFGVIPSTRYTVEKTIRAGKDKNAVVILGDSFSEDPDRKESNYFQKKGIPLLNLAQFGTGPVDYLNRLESKGLRIHPKLVVLNYFVGNDLTDTVYRSHKNIWERVLRTDAWKDTPGLSWSRYLFIPEVFYERWFQFSFFRTIKTRLANLQNATIEAKRKARNPYLVYVAEHIPNFMRMNLLLEGDSAKEAWKKNAAAIEKIAQLTHEQGAKLWINIFPAVAQVNHSHDSFFKDLGFAMSPELANSSIPQTEILTLCQRIQAQCYDLLPEYRAKKEQAFYQNFDDHWNAEGREFALALMHAKWEESGLIR